MTNAVIIREVMPNDDLRLVDERQRGRKIGSQLLMFAENYVKALGCDKIELVSGLHRRQSWAH
ncbi:MAG: GNAT family N-acetyltransferase [Burkholderiales bacterium]|nr:GNAT family N-acetyltransferase [Burkholderiales bacterium]MBP9768756.1 GNAT family N-acetyltransferase [Burkholderiales bacterium]